VSKHLVPWIDAAALARPGVAHLLDYTLLKAEASRDDIIRLCDDAAYAGVLAVCVNGAWVTTCIERLRGTDVKIAAVVGFPLGAGSGAAKAAEAAIAVADGAVELDMVLPLGKVRTGDWTAVTEDVAVVASAAPGAVLKVIIESAMLDAGQVAAACTASVAGGAAFVKTSTGFHPAGGATLDAVRWMRDAVGPAIGVKASGGIRTAEQALGMLAAGANRIGLSSLAGLRDIIGSDAPSLAELLRLTPTGIPR